MRRILVALTAFLALTGTFLILPVYAAPGPAAEPVTTSTDAVEMGSVEAPAPAAEVQEGTTDPVSGVPDSAPTLTVSRTDVAEFSLVGVTWAYDAEVTDTLVQVRVQDATGGWGAWTEVTAETADQGASESRTGAELRGGTSPLWTGPSTGVEVELVTRAGAQPTDVRVDLVDPGESAADTALTSPDITDTAHAATTMPQVYSRGQWGADESIRTWDPQNAASLKAATLHHTADTNNYSADQVPAMMRSIYRYHAVSLGWGDIGYNVIVDKFGRLWEGRYGGLASTVIGAHAGGFNTSTFGVSMLGNYDVVPVPQVTVDAVAAIIAWKFSLYGIDPRGTTPLTSGGGGTARYAAGTRVTLPTIFGHRDVGSTACPGRYGYDRLGEIRDKVAAAMVGAATETISSRYAADAGLRAALGAPLGGQQSAAGVTWQAYERGRLYSSAKGGVHALSGSNLVTYLALGGPDVFGAPSTDELATPDGVGRYNHFTGGHSIYWSPTTGSHAVMSAIRDRWAALGWETSALGYPVSDERGSADGAMSWSTFQNGLITWSPAGGAHAVQGAIEDAWQRLGGLSGVGWTYGLPTTDELATPDGLGRYNHFAGGGSIYWSPATGAHAVVGSIRELWGALGWESSALGYPTSDEQVSADGAMRWTTFQNGLITWSPAGGAHAVQGAIEDAWQRLGGLSGVGWTYGLPTTDELATPDGVGRYNHFAGGASIYWSPATGAHAVVGSIQEKWAALGWESSALGYPTSDEQVSADGAMRWTTFQNGLITWSPAGGAHAVQGAIEDAWQRLGGLSGVGWTYGLPTTDELATPDGLGRYNHFAGGASIYWSPATGAHAVVGSSRELWASLGWEQGPLGYPTTDEVLLADGRTRATLFTGGAVYRSSTLGTRSVYGSIAQAYLGLGGPQSALGLPVRDERAVSGGRRTDFEHGSITWTAATGAITVRAD
ncbi:N-acetylmuramoyl-L-alanine amidase [Modestobacter lacusdianchii]